MRRVVVVGVTGVGKTTFASALSERLGVPHVELDALYWQPQWTPRDPDEFRARIVAEVARDAWVIDGNYSATRDQVWSSADTVIWLNYPLLLIFDRLLRRTLRRGVKREILWGTNPGATVDPVLLAPVALSVGLTEISALPSRVPAAHASARVRPPARH
jgi:adenylate kinase family enzyme